MPMYNGNIALRPYRMANPLEIKGANEFHTRGYGNAPRTLRDLPRSITSMVARSAHLSELSGVGKHLADKIREIMAMGELARFPRLEQEVSAGLVEVWGVVGPGPTRARALYKSLDNVHCNMAMDTGVSWQSVPRPTPRYTSTSRVLAQSGTARLAGYRRPPGDDQ
jgi:DNA polymerase/3'-5' exonuclease PolX